jgi:hypothetical protein
MTAPSVAGSSKVTVPVAGAPPSRVLGEKVTEATAGAVDAGVGLTVMVLRLIDRALRD